jgi:exopolysaccharide biosynthesis WecB/TagA/CpsF family protein
VTPNADHLVRLSRQPELAMLYDNAMLRLLDSRVVGKLARLLGLPAPPVTPGSDLTELLLRRHLHPCEKITVIGLDPQHLPALVRSCGMAPPAHYNPPKGFEHDPSELAAAVQFVLANPARFILLAVGCPRQEILAAAIQATNRATGIGLCIGASLDFLSGAATRAPLWMQHAGLEWFHRLASHPRRLACRYLRDCPAIVPMLLREWKEARQGVLPLGSARGLPPAGGEGAKPLALLHYSAAADRSRTGSGLSSRRRGMTS